MGQLPTVAPYPMPRADELPASVPGWRPAPDRCVLLVHDLQQYFVRPFQPGSSPHDPLLENASALRRRCSALGVPVAYTAQPGGMSGAERGLLVDFWGPGMTEDPADRAVHDAVAPEPGDWLLTKWRYSAFHRTGLLERIREAGRDQLIVCGVYADIGVLMSAVDAFTHDIETFVAADAIADFTEAAHRRALDYAARSCAVVDTTGGILGALGTPAGRVPVPA